MFHPETGVASGITPLNWHESVGFNSSCGYIATNLNSKVYCNNYSDVHYEAIFCDILWYYCTCNIILLKCGNVGNIDIVGPNYCKVAKYCPNLVPTHSYITSHTVAQYYFLNLVFKKVINIVDKQGSQ